MKEIPLNHGLVALVDDEDYEQLSQFKWQAVANHYGYDAQRCDKFRSPHTIRMHREILGTPMGLEVDHINGNRLDNRRANIRNCTTSQNAASGGKKHKRGVVATSKYKGVTYTASGRWKAKVTKSYRDYHAGIFSTEEEAARAYDKKAKELFGDFAYQNFPS